MSKIPPGLALLLIFFGTNTAMGSSVSHCIVNILQTLQLHVDSQRPLPEVVVTKILRDSGVKVGESSSADMVVHDPRFYTRLLSDPDFELGETYMDGLWDSPHIDQVTYKVMAKEVQGEAIKTNAPALLTPRLTGLSYLKKGYRYFRDLLTNRQTRTRAMNVATEHYDAGNELYREMLDPTLTYTSGIWKPEYTLEDAQNAKYDLIARKLGLKPGDRVLDIGSGFGGFARFASKYYQAKVTGLTISVEQLKAARALSSDYKDVNFLFSDYRDIPYRFPPNTFDHVVSIEMVEAVGAKNLKSYFEAAASRLKDGGRFVVQGIASNQDVVNSNPWFSKYIFQDGVAPSTNQIDKAAKASFGRPKDRQNITDDYDKTLLAWHDNFTKAWPKLKEDYSERFKRMWDFYLLSVAGGFRSKKVQLYQTVFVKGGHDLETAGVRDLPSRDRLLPMRATESDKDNTAMVIGALEDQKASVNAALAPRKRVITPLPKDSRIAVVGGGPSGLSSALELKKLGYGNVVVFEKEAVAGGKSHTVDIAGRPHDLGATMGVKLKYRQIEKLAAEHGQKTIPFPEEHYYDLKLGGEEKKPTVSDQIKLGVQAMIYVIQHAQVEKLGQRGLEVPAAELADPWSVVMRRNGLDAFGDKMKTYLTGYGYGGPDTPAVFGERMLDPSAIFGVAMSKPIMWENGTQPIWKGVASGLNVRTNSNVNRIVRNQNGVDIFLNGNTTQPEHFDKLILATDPHATLKMVDPTPEEKDLFSKVKHTPYATFAVRVEGLSQGKSEVGYLTENMTLDRAGHPMAWIKRYDDDNVFVFHLFAPRSIPDEQIMANITDDMKRLGATKLTLVDSRRWPFFPHVDSAAMREDHFYERANNLQGLNNTVFVNEALGMSTMPDSAAQGITAARRLVSGEYGN